MRPRLPLSRLLLLLLAPCGLAACGDDDGSGPRRPGLPAEIRLVSEDGRTAAAGAALPVVVRVLDGEGRPVPGQNVQFVITEGGGTILAAFVATDAVGHAGTTWTLGTAAGPQALEARVGGVDGATLTAATRATARADAPAAVAPVGSPALSGSAGAALDSLAVRVTDRFGNPVPGAAVVWTVRAGGGTVSPGTSTTGADGVAKGLWTLGTRLDSAQVAEAAAGVGISAAFTATAAAPATATLVKVSGDAQQGEAGGALPAPLVVSVRLADGRPLHGATVTWALPAGSSGALTPPVSTTGADGLASAQWTLGARTGMLVAEAAVPGLSSASFTATAGLPGTATLVKVAGDAQTDTVAQTLPRPLVVRLQLPDGRAVAGAEVAWAATSPTSGTLVPAAAVTDAEGLATAQWTLGTVAGAAGAAASVPGGTQVSLSATALPDRYLRPELTPDSIRFVSLKDTARVQRRRVDRFGNTVPGPVELLHPGPLVTVTEEGRVTAEGNGVALLIGRAGTAADTTVIRVQQVVARIDQPSFPDSVFAGDTTGLWLRMQPIGYDARGHTVPGITFTYGSSVPAVAVVSPSGHVYPLAPGDARISITAPGGFTTTRLLRSRAAPRFTSVAPSFDRACALSVPGDVFCWDGTSAHQPAPAAHGWRFSSVTRGIEHQCGISGGSAYCWSWGGANTYGQLGIGDGAPGRPGPGGSQTPARVQGIGSVSSLVAGGYRTCAIETDGDAFCWGEDGVGESGDSLRHVDFCGHGDPCERVPVRVAGGLKFSRIDAGRYHTCALTPAGAAYCWGWNFARQLGNEPDSGTVPYPVPVLGGHTFQQVSVTDGGSCGLEAGGAVRCWGAGVGVTPALVPGGTPFASISGSCGLTAGGDAFCWAPGSGSAPAPTGAGMKWSSLSVSGTRRCGVTTDGRLFCWTLDGAPVQAPVPRTR